MLCNHVVLMHQATEFGRWLPGCRVVLYDGLPEERRALQREVLEPAAFSVCLTHYDLAMRDRSALRKVPGPCGCGGAQSCWQPAKGHLHGSTTPLLRQ